MYSIGVLVGNVSSDHTIKLLHGIESRAMELNVRIIAFLGMHTRDFYEVVFRKNAAIENYDYQNNVVYSYVDLSNLDALLISNSTVGEFLDGTNIDELLEKYGDIPKVLIEELHEMHDCSTIICDNYGGMYKMTTHLIEAHGCRNLVTIAGPENNTDADERLRGIRDAMAAHGLELDDSRIEHSDYSAMVEDQTRRLFERHPDLDAILCGNDLMAETACRICERYGKKPGEDVLITGFDDDEISTNVSPTLTTIRQNSVQIGRRAVDLAIARCKGGPAEHVVDPGLLLLRGSCGCDDHLTPDDFRNRLVKVSEKSRVFQQITWFMPVVSRAMLEAVEDDEHFFGAAMDKLNELECTNAWLLMYHEPIEHEYAAPWTCPQELDVVICMRNGRKTAWPAGQRPKITKTYGLESLGGDRKKDDPYLIRSIIPLFSGKMQLGLLAFEAPIDKLAFIYLAVQQFENAIDFYNLNRALEAKNEVLKTISSRDPMTETLNRRGLMEKVLDALSVRQNRVMRVYLLDMDHLKEINDCFGHGEGDQALIALVRAINELSGGQERLLARIGGDEFLLLELDAAASDPEAVLEELKMALSLYNDSSGKPYYVEASVGYKELPAERTISLTDILECADVSLYEAKKKRRRSAVRPV